MLTSVASGIVATDVCNGDAFSMRVILGVLMRVAMLMHDPCLRAQISF